LEPDPFLGQAYFVPYWNTKKNCYEAQFMPGYRGYIALARRTGEVQTVSAQVVYDRDFFTLQYGLQEKLDHIPVDGDRGNIKGAYVIFRYKDGSYSFDYMTHSDIKAVAMRSATYDAKKGTWSGPWETDEGEMCKKTVIKRHAKLTPMSVEFNRASALEDRAHAGESQMDLLTEDAPGTLIEMDQEADPAPDPDAFIKSIPTGTDVALLHDFVTATAAANKSTQGEVEADAVKDPKNFWKFYGAWAKQQAAKKQAGVKAPIENMMAPGDCPNNEGTTYTKAHCDGCPDLKGCPVWG
jgi:recombinational DNA repair protein RecT